MPCIWGRPRRGSGWRAPESRRQRHRWFVRALQAVKDNRRGGATPASLTPGTMPEEEILTMIPTAPMTTISPPDTLLSQDTTPNEYNAFCVVEEELPDPGIMELNQGQPPDCATSEQVLNDENMHPARNSPPPPTLLHHDHLQLIFDLRSMVEDQAFRMATISQRLDFLFAAYSEASPPRRCPTCVQPFTFTGKGDTQAN
jgi:hypothetical protein